MKKIKKTLKAEICICTMTQRSTCRESVLLLKGQQAGKYITSEIRQKDQVSKC